MRQVSCRKLIAHRLKGPFHTAAFVCINEWVVDNDLSSLKIELEAHLASSHLCETLSHRRLRYLGTIQQKKSATAGAGDLSTSRSLNTSFAIHLVDVRSR